MDIACIARCTSAAVLAASLQAIAQPPEGKGKPAHAGASPFIRFPVPQQTVGALRHSQALRGADAGAGGLAGKTFNDVARANSQSVAGNAFGKSTGAALVVLDSPTGVVNAKAATLPEPVVLATGSPSLPEEKKPPLPECGAR